MTVGAAIIWKIWVQKNSDINKDQFQWLVHLLYYSVHEKINGMKFNFIRPTVSEDKFTKAGSERSTQFMSNNHVS